ncbi:MAG: hypothetical protein K1X74_08605 [Pirellulales bacterium]|nr:hypothetical protein [Pirellulales bacterium]
MSNPKGSSSKAARPHSAGRAIFWLIGPGRSFLVLGVLIALGAAATVGAWPEIQRLVHGNQNLWLLPQNIAINAPPAWIKSDVRAEVVRDAGLGRPISLVDPQLVVRVRNAFSLHPWVARVVQVTKQHPARVQVVLEYRRPVAMVEVPGGLYPVDAEAVLLPSADFSALEASRYPRVSGIAHASLGSVGAVWADVRVQGAARIAAVLMEDWTLLGLQTIKPAIRGDNTLSLAGCSYELFTPRGTRIVWGHAVDASSGEVAAAEKLARLKRLVAGGASLDGAGGPRDIDIRLPGDAVIVPRTALIPAPGATE